MIYTQINSGGIAATVSKVAFGGAVVGDFSRFDYYCTALDRFVELGGNLIDTALCYGVWSPNVPAAIEVAVPANTAGSWWDHGYSSSELMIGQWLKTKNRADVFLATKGAHPVFGKMEDSRVTAECIDTDISRSLRNLDAGYIDLYFLHRDDYNGTYPVSKIMDALNRRADKGEIRAFGASNWTARRIAEANEYAAKHSMLGFSVNQIWFSLADVTPEMIASGDKTLVYMNAHEYAEMKKMGMTVMAYTSQARGFFSKYAENPDAARNTRFGSDENIARLARVRELSKAKNLTPGEIAVAYLTSLDVDVIPILGFSNLDQLTESVRAADIRLTKDETDFLAHG